MGGLFPGGNFPGGNFLGGIFPGGFFHGGIFPDTLHFYVNLVSHTILYNFTVALKCSGYLIYLRPL